MCLMCCMVVMVRMVRFRVCLIFMGFVIWVVVCLGWCLVLISFV